MIAANEKDYFKDSTRTEARAKIYGILAFLYNQLPSPEFIDKVKADLAGLMQCPILSCRTAKVWRPAFLKKMERLESSLGALQRQENILELAVERTRIIRGQP